MILKNDYSFKVKNKFATKKSKSNCWIDKKKLQILGHNQFKKTIQGPSKTTPRVRAKYMVSISKETQKDVRKCTETYYKTSTSSEESTIQ